MNVVIFGSGSLVRSVCHALSASDSQLLEIVIAARSAAQVFEIVAAANIRSSVMGSGVHFAGCETSWEESSIEQLLKRVKPNVILHVASLDSAIIKPVKMRRGHWTKVLTGTFVARRTSSRRLKRKSAD